MKRTKEEAAITRKQILKQALAVFSQKGYAATTLNDIAQAANVTRGAVYHHFNGKADLYNSLIREYSDRGGQIMNEAVSEGGTLLDILRRVFVRQLENIEDDHEMRALMELYLFKTGMIPELELGRQQQLESGKELIGMLTGIMAQGIEQGLLRSDIEPNEMALGYLAYQNGLIQLWLSIPKQFSLKESAHSFADILIAGIEVQG